MSITRLFLFFSILFSTSAFAELLQILHTNDLHSHMEHAVHRPNLGGYGRIKAVMDKFRSEAAGRGIGSITMDGGDFLEGNIFYLADNGRKSAEAYNKIGYDVAVLGNHDYLMGPQDLESLLQDVPPSMNLLAANFSMNDDYPHINEKVRPVWQTTINGIKVGVIGITLNDMLYKWRLDKKGKIEAEVKAARKWARYLKRQGNQIVIALTHIGLSKDKQLAKKIPELDLIVGGHSHIALHEVVYQKSSNGKQIPIVQAGKFGEWIGRILLDYNKTTKTMKIVEYGLNAVYSDVKDPQVEEIVAAANEDLDALFGKQWLSGVVGRSFLRPVDIKNDEDTWNFFINDSMMESVHSDFAVHTNPLSGDNYPVGNVTRRSLYNGNPRHFDFNDKYGYYVYTANVSGALMNLVMIACLNLNVPLYFSGITFEYKKLPGNKYIVYKIRHKGKKISPFKRYNVAFSEAIVRGGFGITKAVGLLLHNAQRTPKTMWQALEEKFNREGDLNPDYLDRYYRQGLTSTDGKGMERLQFVPQ
jgi:5'-nucleotidase/UDP-sugar diphosphatase